MNGNMEGIIETSFDDSIDDNEKIQLKIEDELVKVSRLMLLFERDKPTITHICGDQIDEVMRKAEYFAKGLNIGTGLGNKYPWEELK